MTKSRGSAIPSSASLAFLAVVVLGGINAVAVRIMNAELAPLWGATLRFGIAASVMLVVMGLVKIPLPRGGALHGSILYGAVGIAGAFGCIHWALVHVPAASTQTILALVPLLTLLFASAQGLERVRRASLAGALVAFVGIAIIFGDRLGTATPLPSLAAIVAGAAAMAESNVILKRFPKCHPLANLAVAMSVGTVILLAASVVAGELRSRPVDPHALLALGYVSVVGSAVVFSLFVFVVQRWAASAASYVMLAMPIVTIVVASAITGDAVTPGQVIGGTVVLFGVYLGVLRRPRASGRGPREAVSRVPVAAQPGCA